MKNNIYIIHDSLSNRFGQVYSCASDGVAQLELSRYFVAKNRDGSRDTEQTAENLNRYHLYCCGTIDIETAEVSPLPLHRISWNSKLTLETKAETEATTLPLANNP